MKLVKCDLFPDTNNNIAVKCVSKHHLYVNIILFNMAYADIEGIPFVDYYCKRCVDKHYSNFVDKDFKS